MAEEVSVFHFHYVGHFDPRDFLDLSACPPVPKVQRRLSREAAHRVFAGFDPEIAEYVWYEESGYVGCRWSDAPRRLWADIHRFALALAEAEGAVVMNEPPGWLIEYPRKPARRRRNSLPAGSPGKALQPTQQGVRILFGRKESQKISDVFYSLLAPK